MKDNEPQDSNQPDGKLSIIEKLIEELIGKFANGDAPDLIDYQARYPEAASTLGRIWSFLEQSAPTNLLQQTGMTRISDSSSDGDLFSLKPLPTELSGLDPEELTFRITSESGSSIGRYQVLRQIGQGGFGAVLLGKDTQLERLVAIKLPLLHRMRSEATKHLYIQEAKTLAQLDHPSIVPIYDCGFMPDGRCFVVSKFIEGRDLAKVMKDGVMDLHAIAELISTIGDALHYVHRAQVVHRDIKPGNILVGDDGRYYLADFGLALREILIVGPDSPLVGTFRYMSPELVRREGHRIDGRSDQFSLGVVMYELLTRRSPFTGDSTRSILRSILDDAPVPPDQLDPKIPVELSRICMKLLSKLASQRYSDARELVLDLREWMKSERNLSVDISSVDLASTNWVGPKESTSIDESSVVTPRGLRPFARADAYFYHRLVPGARDREGVPVSIGEWRRWVMTSEEPLELRRVGVISGPTGCGKSSFVRAGLIPSLGSDVVSIIVDATADATEKYLLSAVERTFHGMESVEPFPFEPLLDSSRLSDRIAQIRLGQPSPGKRSIGRPKKLLIVIDQFEQWLYSHPDPMQSELCKAIRQCDGDSVQAILLVRDDFWLGLSRFMDAVESPLQMGRNAMMLDVFDAKHAREVLAELGRGYGKLPLHRRDLQRDQERFLEGAIENLTTNGKIIPVHLSIFAEMVKSRDWSMATLRQLGGKAGVGAQFLMESFSASYAPAHQRAHEQATRSILGSLLPPQGTDIKAGRKSRSEIRQLSGYANDSSNFENLMGLLEGDLKLIGLTDTFDQSRSDLHESDAEETTYQLSHDFLVPSIREWLNSLQRQSWRGRLKQRLEEQSKLWESQPETRFLPSVTEGVLMRGFLPKHGMTSNEHAMLAVRNRRSAVWIGAILLGLISVYWGTMHRMKSLQIQAMVSQLTTADAKQAPMLIEKLFGMGGRARKVVEESLNREEGSEKFLLRCAQLKWDPVSSEEVFIQLLQSSDHELIPVGIEALKPYREKYIDRCWQELGCKSTEFTPPLERGQSQEQRLVRLAQMLCQFDPPKEEETTKEEKPAATDETFKELAEKGNSVRWSRSIATISDALVQESARHPDQFSSFVSSLREIHALLRKPLSQYVGRDSDDSNARFAITLLASISETDNEFRTDIALSGVDWQLPILLPQANRLSRKVLWDAVRHRAGDAASPGTLVGNVAFRRAIAATLLLQFGEDAPIGAEESRELWGLVSRSDDQTCRSKMISQLSEFGVSERSLYRQLTMSTDNGTLAAVLQVLGENAEKSRLPSEGTKQAILQLYREHPDSGVHAAAQWSLQRIGLKAEQMTLPPEPPEISKIGRAGLRHWLIVPNGQCMNRIAIETPELGKYEILMASTEVTVQQFKECDPTKYIAVEAAPLPTCPANVVTWPQAVQYCNWLSRQEGLPEFYPKEEEALLRWGVTPEKLREVGYRLPMAEEWQIAASGGTKTQFHFGSKREEMLRYEWSNENDWIYQTKQGVTISNPKEVRISIPSKPVGLLRPNEFGIFDIYSNVCEWCNDPGLNNPEERQIRGMAAGSLQHFFENLGGSYQPQVRYNSMGMRVVRTLPPAP